MDAIWERNAVGTPPTLPPGAQAGFPKGGPDATVPGPYAWHMITQEIRNAIIGAGLDPDAADVTQLQQALAKVLTDATRYLPPGPNAQATTVQKALAERVSLSRNLTLVEIMSVEAGLGSMDLTAKLQETLNYAYSIGGRVVDAFPGVFKCNLSVPKGLIIQGSGRGMDVNFNGHIPMTSNYAFAGGGSTFIPANRALPVFKSSGSGGASGWPLYSLRDLKVSDNSGAIVAGTVGVLAELSANFELYNVEIRNLADGLKISSPGKTSWSWKLDHVTISDCTRGMDVSAATQNATPQVMLNVDIRRCTEYGAKFDHFTCLGWYGGTVADNEIGVIVRGDTNGQAVVGFRDIQWETNRDCHLKIGDTDTFPGGPITVSGGQFVDYRSSAGDGSTWPSVFAGSVAIRYNVNEPTSRLVLRGVSFVCMETVIDYDGQGIVTRDSCRLYGCTQWGNVFLQGTEHDLEQEEYGAARKDAYVGLGFRRLRVKSNDFSTYGNNFYITSANHNGASVSGLLPDGTGTLSQWALYNTSDPDNAGYGALEVSPAYFALFTGARGTGTAPPLVIQRPGGVIKMFEGPGAGQLAGFGTPTNGAVIANFNATTATLQQTAQMVAAMAAHFKARGDFGA